MLYTRKGDKGTTKAFDTKPGVRISKASARTEALGSLDEVNSLSGLVKIKIAALSTQMPHLAPSDIEKIQNWLFVVQAEVAGAPKTMSSENILELESMIDKIEKELPPIKSFLISGGTELTALCDFARTLARKAERRVVAGMESQEFSVGEHSLAFLNRLSSYLYVCARYANHVSGVEERGPGY
jgi:cob(I)alamin adenosyltransferase